MILLKGDHENLVYKRPSLLNNTRYKQAYFRPCPSESSWSFASGQFKEDRRSSKQGMLISLYFSIIFELSFDWLTGCSSPQTLFAKDKYEARLVNLLFLSSTYRWYDFFISWAPLFFHQRVWTICWPFTPPSSLPTPLSFNTSLVCKWRQSSKRI